MEIASIPKKDAKDIYNRYGKNLTKVLNFICDFQEKWKRKKVNIDTLF